jgi:hypothetical protein
MRKWQRKQVELLRKLNIADERIKLELWSVIFGSLIIDLLIIYAGNLFWLFLSGAIFGSMSRRLFDDFLMCGSVAIIATGISIFFFHLNLLSVYSFPLQLQHFGAAGAVILMLLTFLLSASGAYAGSYSIVRYVRKKYGRDLKLKV